MITSSSGTGTEVSNKLSQSSPCRPWQMFVDMLLLEVGVEVTGNLLPGGVSRHKLLVGVERPLLVGVSKPTILVDSGGKSFF